MYQPSQNNVFLTTQFHTQLVRKLAMHFLWNTVNTHTAIQFLPFMYMSPCPCVYMAYQ